MPSDKSHAICEFQVLKTNKTVIIFDSDKPVTKNGILYRWNGYDYDNGSNSLLQLLDDNSDKLRQRFLKIQRSFVSTLYKNIIEFSNINSIEIDLLRSSLLVEKSVFKSPCLLDSLRLLSLEMELRKIECTNLCYIGSQRPVAGSLERFCKPRNIEFSWEQTSDHNTDTLIRRIWKQLPSLIRSLVFIFRYAWNYWNLRKVDNPKWYDSPDAIFLFSYFIHLDQKSSKIGNFYSKQWEVLPKFLQESGRSLNWIHLFLYSPLVPNTTTGIRLLNNFNRNKRQQGIHTFLNSFLGWDILFRTFRDYFKSYFRFYFSRKKMDQDIFSLPYGWMWPIMKKDWRYSTLDVLAAQNILWLHLFDKAIASLPHQRIGLYLCENQDWERSFTRAWRKHNHGKLIGVAHSTIGYWDMRYFDQTDGLIDYYRPDAVAVNGLNAWGTLKAAGQFMDQYVKVEALRYQYLNEFTKVEDSGNKVHQKNQLYRMLILGDIQPETTHRILLTVDQAYAVLESKYEVWVKPHPANPVDLRKYPLMQATIVEESLNKLLPHTDLVLTSVFTSAGLDAFCAGIRVISYLDPNNLNYSLLRGIDGIEFISSSKDLVQSLDRKISISENLFNPENFFWLNQDLPLWRDLLEIK